MIGNFTRVALQRLPRQCKPPSAKQIADKLEWFGLCFFSSADSVPHISEIKKLPNKALNQVNSSQIPEQQVDISTDFLPTYFTKH